MSRHLGLVLALQISFGASIAEACKNSEFRCFNGECIDDALRCDGKADCYDETDETLSTCIGIRCPNRFQCEYGGCISEDKECDGTEDCHDGSDEGSYCSSTGGVKRKECALPEKKNGSVYSMMERGAWVKFDSPSVVVSTVIRVECELGYGLLQQGDNPICGDRGKWIPTPTQCLECGRRKQRKTNREKREVVPLIKHAPIANTVFTWHVALYNISRTGTEDKVTNICGGSILTERAILTAAHCVHDASPRHLRVAIGKFRSSWYLIDADQQNYKVRQIITHYGYNTTSYKHDIAILIVDEMKFTQAALPVCIDWTSNHWARIKSVSLRETLLQAVGWGETENFSMSYALRETKLAYYDNADCRRHIANNANNFDSDFIAHITQDKFCVGFLNGTYLYHGDSGGGVTFSVGTVNGQEVHFLYGIVSFTDKISQQLTAITNVGMYRDWLRDKLR